MEQIDQQPERRIGFLVSYDGTDFVGWQRQRGGLPTIQGCLEAVMEDFFKTRIQVDGASRTDAGVHARSQVAAITIRHPIELSGLEKVVNTRLPKTIAIREPRVVPESFFARRAVQSKTYRYELYRGRWHQPLIDRFSTRISYDLSLHRLQNAAQQLIGTHDFKSFAASDGQAQQTVRTIQNIVIDPLPQHGIRFSFTGTGFLKQMVRNLVGSLIEVGRGHRSVAWIQDVLMAQDRTLAGPTAPPQGLTLWDSNVNWQYETAMESAD